MDKYQEKLSSMLANAISMHRRKLFSEASLIYKILLSQDSSSDFVINFLGLSEYEQGNIEIAKILMKRSIYLSRKPDYYSNIGIIFRKEGDLENAIFAYRMAIALMPDYPDAYNNLGNALNDINDKKGAATSYRRSLTTNENQNDAAQNLISLLISDGQYDDAELTCLARLKLDPNNYKIQNLLGISLKYKENHSNKYSVSAFKKTAVIDPTIPDAYYNLCHALFYRGSFPEAISAIKIALKLNPLFAEAHFDLALLLLLEGNITQGWDEYEWRFLKNNQNLLAERAYKQPIWDGSNPEKKRLLIWSEQGIGDIIMFSSCIHNLNSLGAIITLECPSKLKTIFERSFPSIHVKSYETEGKSKEIDFDIHIPIGSLPKLYRQTLSDFPAVNGFLTPDPILVNHWRRHLESLGPGPYVGISWRGKLPTGRRGLLYTEIKEWNEVLKIPNITFVNMQYIDANEEVEEIYRTLGVRIHCIENIDMWDDLDNVAALLSALDLLIAVDTAVFSLSGGVGLPTWLVSVNQPEAWPRLGTDHFPWYPNLRLFTRTLEQPWSCVMREVATELASRFEGNQRPPHTSIHPPNGRDV